MYLHSDNDEFISLHDCHATKVLFENGVLTFVFEDGFWIIPAIRKMSRIKPFVPILQRYNLF